MPGGFSGTAVKHGGGALTASKIATALGLQRGTRTSNFSLDPQSLRQRLQLIAEGLKQERASFDSHWSDLAQHILPKQFRRWISDANKGTKAMEKIVDSIATLAVRDLQAGMLAGMASPSRPWFAITVGDPRVAEDHDAKEWLDGVRHDILRVLSGSNFYTSLGQMFGAEAVFATAAMAIVKDDDDVIRCYGYPVGSFWLGTYGTGRICVFHREFRMTVRQLVEEYGEDAVTQSTRDNWRKGITEAWVDACHTIVPNADAVPYSKRATRKKFYEAYYEKADYRYEGKIEDKLLAEAGYDQFPVIVARWDTAGDDVYGTMSPGMVALPDVKQLMQMRKYGANAMAAVVKPPMQYPASFTGSEISLVPGDSTEVINTQDGNAIRPIIQVDPHLADLQVYIQEMRKAIESAFYRDLFRMLIDDERDQRATAEEIRARSRERLSVLGPVLERHNDDVFEPAIERVYAIMWEAGLIPLPPESMIVTDERGNQSGVPLKIEYQSEVALAQRAVGLGGLERHVAFAGQLAPLVPPVLDNIDWDKVMEEHADAVGVSPKITRSEEDREAVRQARAEAQRQAEMQAAIPAAAKATRDLAASPVSEDNALGQIAAALNEEGG